MEINEIIKLCRARSSGERAFRAAADYRKFPLRLSFSSCNSGIEWLCREYEKAGLETEKIEFPADGRTVYGDRRFPLAWDIEDGWLKSADPGFPVNVLASYREDPYGIVPFSADSGGEVNACLVPFRDIGGARGRGRDPGGTVVLFERLPSREEILDLTARGFKAAAICASDSYTFGIPSSNPGVSKLRRWLNAVFSEGKLGARDPSLCAYSLRPEDVSAVLKRYRRKGPVPVRYLMKTRTYSGEFSAALARVEGRTIPGKSFMLAAHAYEPNATNNVSGVAICLEAARVLSGLIADGRLPAPARSIQFFHGMELFSIYAWALRNPSRVREIVAGLALDNLGARDRLHVKEKLHLFNGGFINPSFSHYLIGRILASSAEEMGIEYEIAENGFSSNEDMLNDPMFGPAFSLVYGSQWYRTGNYHSNGDSMENISPARLGEMAAFAAAVAYTVSAAEGREAADIAGITCEAAINGYLKSCLRLSSSVKDAHERGIALKIYRESALPSFMESIESSANLVPEKELEEFGPEITSLSGKFRSSAENITSSLLAATAKLSGREPVYDGEESLIFKYGRADIERAAARMVPSRAFPGILSLGTGSEEAKKSAAEIIGHYSDEYWNFMAPLYYWFDGRRTLLEAANAHYAVTDPGGPAGAGALPGFTCSTAGRENGRLEMVGRFLDLAGFLEKHGYIKVERRCAPVVSRLAIEKGLERLGIRKSDVLMVHSSMSSFGRVEGGASAVIESLMEAVGEDGIVAMPAFTYGTLDGAEGPPFDPRGSGTQTGAVPSMFITTEGVARSSHPTHSVAAWGSRAGEFVSSGDWLDAFDWNGPWGRLFKWGGKILSFGETFGSATYLHALEAWFLPYLDRVYARVRRNGGECLVLVTNYPGGCRGGWYRMGRKAAYFKRLSGLGLYRETLIGEAAAMAIGAGDMTRALHGLFLEDPAVMLHKSGCLSCSSRRALLEGWEIPGGPPGHPGPGSG